MADAHSEKDDAPAPLIRDTDSATPPPARQNPVLWPRALRVRDLPETLWNGLPAVAGNDLQTAFLARGVEEISRELGSERFTELLDRDRTAGIPPDSDALERALRTVLDFLATRDRAQYESVVDAVSRATALDENRLYQARLHGERKRWLIDHVRLLSTEDLIELMPDRVVPGGNAARALKGLRDRNEILGVRVMRDWRYPADQLDARGEVHAALPDVLAEAREQGYTPWEVLYWLFAPSASARTSAIPGRRLPPLETEESLEQIAQRAVAAQRAEPESDGADTVRPMDLLAGEDTDAFDRLARRWLGRHARSATAVG